MTNNSKDLKAEAYEADGDLGKAINLYSRAEKLDEDVFTKVRQSRPERVKPVFGGDYEKVSKSNVDEDLQKNLQSLKISSSISSGHHFDKPDFTAMTSSKPSLVDFPTEVIQKIMKRLACSGHLISIGKLSLVCKFLHNQAEDDSLWKLACRNFFDAETLQELYELNGNYKTCYLKTPKVNYFYQIFIVFFSQTCLMEFTLENRAIGGKANNEDGRTSPSTSPTADIFDSSPIIILLLFAPLRNRNLLCGRFSPMPTD